jgi:Flp pilus assembly protein TadG
MIANSRRNRTRRGSSILEFVLVGIPIIFVLISLFEISRGMWTYHTMAYAVREGVRYATVHGKGCASPNTCQVTIGQITSVIKAAGVGLPPSTTTITLTPASGSASSDTMTNQLASTTVWPPSGANTPGQDVKIKVSYPFRTILAIFWVGAGRPLNDSGTFNLGASSTEPIKF